MDFCRVSTSAKIEKPVVENPEQLSKNASVKLEIVPVSKYGTVPKMQATTQEAATNPKAPRVVSRILFLRSTIVIISAKMMHTAIGHKNAGTETVS
jgi:hypothetical protein